MTGRERPAVLDANTVLLERLERLRLQAGRCDLVESASEVPGSTYRYWNTRLIRSTSPAPVRTYSSFRPSSPNEITVPMFAMNSR
jgi:hypothetical protein